MTTRTAAIRLGGAGIMAALALAGCSGRTTAPVVASADDFRSQANAICAGVAGSVATLAAPGAGAPRSTVVAYFERGRVLGRRRIDRLAALETPSDLRTEVRASLAALEAEQDVVNALTARVAGGVAPTAAVAALRRPLARLGDAADVALTTVGLTDCTERGWPPAVASAGPTPATGSSSSPTVTDYAGVAPRASTAAARVTAEGFLADATAASRAIEAYGKGLSASGTITGVRSRADALRLDIDGLESRLERMAAYTLDGASLDAQRARIVDQGRPLADVMREIVTRAVAGDGAGVSDATKRFRAAARAFARAARP